MCDAEVCWSFHAAKALLYAEPIYLQAQRSPMPELRLVVLALQDRLAYAPNFEGALASLFGSEGSSLSQEEAPQAQTPAVAGAPKPTETQSSMIAQAGRDFLGLSTADFGRQAGRGWPEARRFEASAGQAWRYGEVRRIGNRE